MSCFTPRKKVFKGRKNFDQDYIDISVRTVVEKTGEGEEDYVLVEKVVPSKRNIDKFINAQNEEVGVYNLLDRLQRTGDDSILPGEWKQDGVIDYTGMPKDLMEADAMVREAHKTYNKLPKELKKGSLKELAEQLSDEDVKTFVASLIERSKAIPTEEKKGE